MWGFFHSTFLTTPVTETGLVLSYSVANEWCARIGTPITVTSAAESAAVIFMVR
jgi:hypothetical protein